MLRGGLSFAHYVAGYGGGGREGYGKEMRPSCEIGEVEGEVVGLGEGIEVGGVEAEDIEGGEGSEGRHFGCGGGKGYSIFRCLNDLKLLESIRSQGRTFVHHRILLLCNLRKV